MTVQHHELTPALIGPPTPTMLDGVLFVSAGPEAEFAWAADHIIGALYHDDESGNWAARFDGGDLKPMRCRAEARARIVSAFRARGISPA